MSQADDLIIELQTKVSFQDELLDGLNQVVTSQQQQIMRLETAFAALKLQVKTLQTDNNQTEVNEPPPPHY